MPLNVRKFGVSCFLALSFVFGVSAQAPTSADLLRERITKAKVMVALKSYTAAIYELEGIRRETNDASVNSVVQVMLMSCYLEQSDYKRANALLAELFNAQKINKPNANYFAVAAQVVKGARAQLDRYKSLGLTVSDRNLPVDAVADVNRMREAVETVITQSKVLGADKKQTPNAMALLEEASSARRSLARDDYDSRRWQDEVADARESLMNSRAVVNAVDDSLMQSASADTVSANSSPQVQKTTPPAASMIPVSNPLNAAGTETAKPPATDAPPAQTGQIKAPEKTVESPKAAVQKPAAAEMASQPPTRNRRVPNPETQTAPKDTSENSAEAGAANAAGGDAPLAVGSLLEYATEKVNPTYPQAAKTMRTTGIVRVEVVVNEEGQIAQVQNTSGPSMLQRAAQDAVKRWRFKPFTRDGQPVKATGFVNFNFSL